MRRSLLVLPLAVVLVAAVGWSIPAAAAPTDEWLQAGHDAGHTFANLGETQLTPATLKALPWPGLSWSTVDVGLTDVSSPLIDGDSMVVTSIAWDYNSGRLERFDIPTEQRLWVHSLSCFGFPSLTSDSIVITDDCSVSDPAPAQVLSIDDASLRYAAAAQLGIVHRGVGYFANYGDGAYLDPWTITAQDLATENILWTKSTASYSDPIEPVLAAGDTLYVRHAGAIEAWDTATGDLRWSRTPTQQVTPFAATPDALYVRWQAGDLHGIARWGAADGQSDWRRKTPAIDTPFAITPHGVYETGPDFLAERSASNGSILWKRSGYFWSYLGQPVYAAGVLWAWQQGSLEAYNAGNGRELLSESTAPSGPITVAGGRVFIGSPDGRVFIYQLPA